jgi:RNA polymerase sigma-70 factor (ECF subfamily)
MSCDELEFETIHAAFRPKIHRYLSRMVGEYEAEDLTQEVFVRVSQALKAFRGESELSTWIYRIATNAALDRLRSPSFQRTIQDCPANPFVADGESELDVRNAWTGEKVPLVEGQVFRKEMNDCFRNLINSLPEAYRTALVLSEFEGFRNNEIAEILGVTLDTIKIRLHRARERLKEELELNCDSSWVEGNEYVPELKRSDLGYLPKYRHGRFR